MNEQDRDANVEQAQAWLEHLKFEPEEARLLGLEASGRKSLARLPEQVDFYRGLSNMPERAVSPALRRLARLVVRRFDRGEEHASLERSMSPRLVAMEDAAARRLAADLQHAATRM